MNTFEKVKVGGDWVYHDQLKGVTLTDGEAVEVWWPSRIISVERLVVKKGERHISDHGNTYPTEEIRAFIPREVNGVEVLISVMLDGIELRRVP